MKIGEPVAGYVVEPIQHPVPQERPNDEERVPREPVAAQQEPIPER